MYRGECLSDDPTRELLQPSPFEARVLAEFAAIRGEQAAIRVELRAMRDEIETIRSDIATLNARQERFENRLNALEEKVDARLSETRPIWESVLVAIERLDMKLDKVILDLYELRAQVGLHDRRLTRLESR